MSLHSSRRMKRFRSRLARSRGAAAIEFALIAPLFALIMLGGFDLAMWIRSGFRLDELTSQIGEIISRCSSINDPGDIDNFFAEANEIASPLVLDSQTDGAFIITAMGLNNGQQVILWQEHEGNPIYASRFGSVGQTAITGAYTLSGAEVLIGTEVYSPVQPWSLGSGLLNLISTAPLYAHAMFLVRSSNTNQLATLGSGSTPACAS